MLLCWVYETTLERRGRLWWAVCMKMAKSQQSWIAVYLLYIYIFLLFDRSVMSDSLHPYGLHRARLPCTSLSPEVCSNSHPLSQWCHPTISFPVALFSCPQSFPASESFPMNRFFSSGGQRTEAAISAPVLPMTIQCWFPLGSTALISLQSIGFSRVFFSTAVWKHQVFDAQPPSWSNSHIFTWLLEKPYLWLYGPLSAKCCLWFLICCLGWS